MRLVMLSWHAHLSELGLDMDCLMLAYIFVWSTGYSRRLGLDMDCLMLAYIFVWSTGYSRRLGLDMDCLMLAYILYGVQATAED